MVLLHHPFVTRSSGLFVKANIPQWTPNFLLVCPNALNTPTLNVKSDEETICSFGPSIPILHTWEEILQFKPVGPQSLYFLIPPYDYKEDVP